MNFETKRHSLSNRRYSHVVGVFDFFANNVYRYLFSTFDGTWYEILHAMSSEVDTKPILHTTPGRTRLWLQQISVVD